MIAFDTAVNATGNTTWSHICTGSNLVLLVGVHDRGSSLTGVTYNGVSMTLIDHDTETDGTSYLYGMVNPPTGSHTVAIAITAGDFTSFSASYTGVAQTGLPDSHTTIGAAMTPTMPTTTVVAKNCWLVYTGFNHSGGTATISTNITDRDTNQFQAGNHYAAAFSDTNGTVGTGAQGLTISGNGATEAGVLISIAPALNSSNFFLMF